MASAIYRITKQAWLSGAGPDMSSETTIKAYLIDAADYTFSQAHDFIDDVPAPARVAGPVTLTTTTVDTPNPGTFDCADFTFTAVTGDQSEALIIYHDSGAEATSRVIAYIDSFTAVIPNGGDIAFTVDSGTDRVFTL